MFFYDELTTYSNDNFSIIGRYLFLATKYENTFKSYIKALSIKNFNSFITKIQQFKSLTTIEDIIQKIEKLPFHSLIDIFFDHIINMVDLSEQKKMFIEAKNFRNYIAHELCIDLESVIEKNSYQKILTFEMKEKSKQMILCTLIMDNFIAIYNKDNIVLNIEKKAEIIMNWTVKKIK